VVHVEDLHVRSVVVIPSADALTIAHAVALFEVSGLADARLKMNGRKNTYTKPKLISRQRSSLSFSPIWILYTTYIGMRAQIKSVRVE
jgi:hypothetical protein